MWASGTQKKRKEEGEGEGGKGLVQDESKKEIKEAI